MAQFVEVIENGHLKRYSTKSRVHNAMAKLDENLQYIIYTCEDGRFAPVIINAVPTGNTKLAMLGYMIVG